MTLRSLYRAGPHWIALVATAFTLPLLYVGGSVTTYRVGLAVPDWPSTFGENPLVYDFWNAPLGVRIEHLHRLYGAAVGLATMLLAGWFVFFEPRRLLKWLSLLALAAVIVQGVLGGMRVTQISTLLAAVHGCVGQAFFGLMVALCVMTGSDAISHAPRAVDPDRLRRRAGVALALVYAQIVLGSWLRHYAMLGALGSHASFALCVWLYAGWLLFRVERVKAAVGSLVWPARVLALTLSLQILLGLAALAFLLPWDGMPRPVTLYSALIRTGHQTNGAVILAASVVLALRAMCRLGPSAQGDVVPQLVGRARRPEPAALDWEVA
jgi:cytochrome c oxidase assembly protein subunit 15